MYASAITLIQMLAFGFPIDKPITLDEIPKEFLEACAMIDGKRECYQNTPSLTQLCYSNPKVVERMTDAVLNYATEHPEIYVLYFWLADRFNCSCECEECTKTTINDIYVNMVDIATKKLRKNNINTKDNTKNIKKDNINTFNIISSLENKYILGENHEKTL